MRHTGVGGSSAWPVLRDRWRVACGRGSGTPLPALSALLSVATVLALAVLSPGGRAATEAVRFRLEEGLSSVRGIFDFSGESLSRPTAPGSEAEVVPPVATPAPRFPEPREVGLPVRRIAQANGVPEVARELDVPRPSLRMSDVPQIAVPRLADTRSPSGYFGSRPEAIPRAPVARTLMPGPTVPVPRSLAAAADSSRGSTGSTLEGYRSTDRIGFSRFRTSRSLSGELARLTRIERFLSTLRGVRRLSRDGAEVVLTEGRAQVTFMDGVAFTVTFRLGRLEDIGIFQKETDDRRILTEVEAVRGIRLLAEIVAAGGRRAQVNTWPSPPQGRVRQGGR